MSSNNGYRGVHSRMNGDDSRGARRSPQQDDLQGRYSANRPSAYVASYKKRNSSPWMALIISLLALLAVIVAAIAVGTLTSNLSEEGNDQGILGLLPAVERPIEDPDNIVMTLGGSRDTYVLKGEEYLEAGCHAIETGVGDITDTVVIEGKVDTSKTGDYEVAYIAENSQGQRSKTVRTVHVVDAFEENAKNIPVLMYHYVYTESDVPTSLNNNYILDTKLTQQCEYLRDNDYYYPSYQELAAFVAGSHTLPAKSVILTFDDCERGFLEYGVPILNEYEVPATSFVICVDDDALEKTLAHASEFVQFQSHTYNLHRGGSGVGQGGIIHALSKDEIVADLLKSQDVLGGTVTALAYPFGDNNETAWKALGETDVICAFTVKNDRIRPGDNQFALNRVRLSGEYGFESFKALVAPNGSA